MSTNITWFCKLLNFGALPSRKLWQIWTNIAKEELAVFFISFFFKLLEDISSFWGATDTPVLDFWWRWNWVLRPVQILCLRGIFHVFHGFLRFTSVATPYSLGGQHGRCTFVTQVLQMISIRIDWTRTNDRVCHSTSLQPFEPVRIALK